MVSDYVVSLIRTYVPMIVGAALVELAKALGFVISPDASAQAVVIATGLVTAAYYALVRLLERRWPALGWLLGSPKAPSYTV